MEKAGTFFIIKNNRGYFVINVTIHAYMFIKGNDHVYSFVDVDIDMAARRYGLSPTVMAMGSNFPPGYTLRLIMPK